MPTPKGELSKKNIKKLKAYLAKRNESNTKSGSKKPK